MPTSPISKQQSLPSLSASSITQSHSVRNNVFTIPSSRAVVTAPPWAQDEPPSPTDQPEESDGPGQRSILDNRPSDLASASRTSFAGITGGTNSHPPWWTFARPRQGTSKHDPKGAGPSDHQWPGSRRLHNDPILTQREKQFTDESSRSQEKARDDYEVGQRGQYAYIGEGQHVESEAESSSLSRSRKNRFRAFILSNIYVPLLFRFINITFTTSALAVAIQIRLTELHYNVMGVVGSSPTLVIIFAPLTLVHVMVAIYLEYFSRPLGLWRTSGKLAHTLLEVCCICAWSAALSLCFDNYFTSLIPCAPPKSTAWYSQLPQPRLNLPSLDNGGIGTTICDNQLVLICLVMVGLIMYCINLVISLFRIFEKVKYHAGTRRRA
ncbi:hypothetical protein PAXRUDRAFT_826044 [Paxillus rubicundulus Ve08.2h10]|uniref:Uncharacterized protein n=1 Tax=Paxillus rubicundulus Ve08.2h10 TaxID=930991 RepID=A0A0D0EA70_9AGAM|nr:hypothetical protein PAXRUDRAFT_826044 [Paxillus rubicundulus Ve08.2h10]